MIRYLKTKLINLFFGKSMDPTCLRFFHCHGCYTTDRPKTCNNKKCSLCEKRREYKKKKTLSIVTASSHASIDGTNTNSQTTK